MNNRIIYFSLFIATSIFSACEDSELEEENLKSKQDDLKIREHLSDNNISAQKDDGSGIYWEVLNENPGGETIDEDDIISVYYRITLLDGKVLEARTSDLGPPLKFSHEDDALYPEGINYGVSMMRKGEKFRFYLPSRWGLQDFYVNGFFGPEAILIAEVEVVDVFDYARQIQIENDSILSYLTNQQLSNRYTQFPSGLFMVTQKAGSGFTPNQNQSVTIHFTRKYLDGTIVRTTIGGDPTSFQLNSGRAIEGLEQGLRQMQPGEKALLLVPSNLGFGAHIQVFPQKFRDSFVEDALKIQNVYPFAPLIYEVELLKVY